MIQLQFDEFARRVARASWNRHQIKVSPRILRKWADEDIIPRLPKKGLGRGGGFSPVWTRDSYRAALKISRMIKHGATLIHTYRVTLWLWDAEIEFERLQPSFVKEVQRLRFHALKDRRSTASPLGSLDIRQRRSLLKVMSVGDSTLQRHIVDETSQLAAIALLEGVQRQPDVKTVLGSLIKELPGKTLGTAGPALSSSLTGIMGDPEMIEGSGLENAQNATQLQLESARHHFQAHMRTISKLAIIAKALENDPRGAELPFPREIQFANAKLKSPEMQIILFWQILNGTLNNPIAWRVNPSELS